MAAPAADLIPDLCDIVGRYSDQKTYQNLIQIDSQTYTKEKLIKQESKDIQIDNVLALLNAYRISEKFIIESKDSRGSILYVAGILLPFLEFYDITEFDQLKQTDITLAELLSHGTYDISQNNLYAQLVGIIQHSYYNPFTVFDVYLYVVAAMLYDLIPNEEKLGWFNHLNHERAEDTEISKNIFEINQLQFVEQLTPFIERALQELPDVNLHKPKTYLKQLLSMMKTYN